jgi:hypothetical protein
MARRWDRAAKSDYSRNHSAREHSPYAEDRQKDTAKPADLGDYCDPVKHVVGRGNASSGPYKEQGGEGHGDNYGARQRATHSASGKKER